MIPPWLKRTARIERWREDTTVLCGVVPVKTLDL